MPAKNPRLTVVLSPSVAATLAALSDATGESTSSVVRGLLEQAEPGLQRMLQLVKATQGAKAQIGAGVGDALERVAADFERVLAMAETRAGYAVGDLVESAEAVKGRRRGPGGGAARAPVASSTPGLVTRGSGSRKTGRKGKTPGGQRGSL